MKLWKRILTLCLAACMCLSLFACATQEPGQTENTTDTTDAPENGTYTVQVLSETGMAFEGVGVYIYEDDTLAELVWFAKTDATGSISFTAERVEGCVAVLENVPRGYAVAESYPLTGAVTKLALEIQMPSAENLAEMTFGLGDVICDLQVTDVNGNIWQISELLKEKDAVMLNFWYLDCTPCKMEFPYLQKAYEEAGDKVAVLAVNPIDTDTAAIAAYAEELGLTFPVAAGTADLQKAMGLVAYPTTVIVDRNGIISLIHQGSVTSARSFRDIFDYFTAEDYVPGVVEDVNSILSGEADEEEIENPTSVGGVTSFQLTVKPGEVVYCDVYRADGMYLQVKAEDAFVEYKGTKHTPVNGAIGLTIYTPDTRTPAQIGMGNEGTETTTYTLTLSAARGALNNPYPMSLGEFDVKIYAGNQEGVYYQYTAESDGYLTLQCLSATEGVPYGYTLYNLNTYANRNLEADAVLDKDGNTVVRVKVTKGQTVQFNASALPDNNGSYPAIDMRFLASIVDGSEVEEEDDSKKIVYAVSVTDENRQPIANVPVYITTEKGTENLKTDANGAAAIKLLPGTYKATVKVPSGYSAKTTELTLTEAAPTQTLKFDTVVVVTKTYTVTVTDEDGKAMADVLVTVGENFAYTDEAGAVSFTMDEGVYTAVISIPEGYTADTMSYDFPEGQTELTVVLKKGSGTVDPGEEKIPYTVKIVDYFGNPVQGATVSFLKDGAVVGLQQADALGTATAQLAKGSYTVTLAFDSGACQYDESAAVLSEDVTTLTITAIAKVNPAGKHELYVGDAYSVGLGATYASGMQANVVNYFIFNPSQSGVYSFTTTDPNAVISYHGANDAYIADQTAATDYANNTYTRQFREDQVENAMTIIGITGSETATLLITRIGDIQLSDEEKAEWIIFEGKETPASGTVYKPTETGTVTFVDLTGTTAANQPVKGDDGFYHLGSKTGPILYVKLGPNGYRYVSFYNMMGNEQGGGARFSAVFYEGNTFIKKEMYNDCLKAYTLAVDAQGEGLYPLNDDLVYMLQNGGRQMNWWNETHPNYLFSGVKGLNTEIAWMFNVCYFK